MMFEIIHTLCILTILFTTVSFSNSIKEWVGGFLMELFAGGEFFYWVVGSEKWFCQIESFSKLQTTFYIYWTSINVKTSMTCQYKEYEVKTKIVQEQQLYLKMKFLLNYNLFWALALECTVAFSLVQKYIFDCCSDPFSQFFPIYGERLYFQVFLNSLKSWEIGTFEIFLISYLPFWA